MSKLLILIILFLFGCEYTECKPPLSGYDKCGCFPDICKPSTYKPKESGDGKD